jgi:hypothetical protein
MADQRRQRDEVDRFLEEYQRDFHARRTDPAHEVARVAG